jgi:hypothetical protein
MKKLVFIIIPALMLVMSSFSGCEGNVIAEEVPYIQAKVRFISAPDFCDGYMIIIGDELAVNHKIYKPNNLPIDYQVDNLSVNIIFETLNDEYNCGFAGYVPIINITNIELQ